MTIALFGGTGRTGQFVIKEALEKGYKLKVLARDSLKLGEFANSVEVVVGDVMNLEDVNKTIEGTDVVISVIGHGKNTPSNLMHIAAENIIKSMKDNSIQRLIAMTGFAVKAPGDNPTLVDKIVVKIMETFVGKVLNDSRKYASLIQNSNLDWTIVRAPSLNNSPKRGEYKAGMVGEKGFSFKVSREDIADFIIKEIERKKYIKQMPAVCW